MFRVRGEKQAHKSSPRRFVTKAVTVSKVSLRLILWVFATQCFFTSLSYLEGDRKESLSRMFTVCWDSVGAITK